ncbi:MAG: aromatic ring-hydroxylating dioxygenase subunit alpha [Novosphingobium sp.]|nr:aromatic ring-hydroxylating dioxygenase subunit alpha [Novosphingobium sp.]
MSGNFSSLVNEEGSRVSRRLFADEAVFEAELEQVFGKSWLFLGHESQVPRPGDFFRTRMGDESIILIRGNDGEVRAFLNSCRHRGLPICRQDKGNAKAFVCPYHAWTYASDGSLRGVPRQSQSYPDGLDKSKLGLVPVAHMANHRGLIFGSFDPDIIPLEDYLGDMAWYLDCHLARAPGGTEVLGLQRWEIDCNWKMPAENQIGDVCHGPFSHVSLFEAAGGIDQPAVTSVVDNGVNVAVPNGHGCVVAGMNEPERELGLGDPSASEAISGHFDKYKAYRVEHLGALREHLDLPTATVFPNFSILGRNSTIRVAHPISATRTEMWSWILVDKAADPEAKEAFRKQYQVTFGPGGMLESDDGENWSGVMYGARGSQSRKQDYVYEMGMGSDGPHAELPGSVGHTFSEHTQRGYYRRWRELMSEAVI